MTNPFDTAAIAARTHFKNAFGEEAAIVILPDGVTERPVTAILSYQGAESVPGISHGKAESIELTVDNDAATGLSTDEFDAGKALVDVPERIGGEVARKRMTKILSQDAGMVTYQVR